MATVTPNVDPSTIVPVTPKAPKTVVTSAAPTPTSVAGVITPIPTTRRKGRVTKADVEFARKMTGYNDTSPIWGKRLPEILVEIESLLQEYIDDNGGTSSFGGHNSVERALLLNRELQKRTATYKVISASRK